ncbi:MAG: peptidase U32 [Desulfobulbaceae bacterium]|nr:MAG: peptidase U32 [Desulfobulbaceae bacterium]
MTLSTMQKPELLAPAGSIEAFEAAVAQGADAVYIGAPAFNARNLARHFSVAEIAAMIDYGHGHGVKVYLAANSLMREEEIPAACDLLAMSRELGPDALIIQDLGLYYLAHNHFPELELHASTLMGAHNSVAVKHMGAMGFQRVVLAREMTLAEIDIACRQGVEIEVFIHGALCFAYSGLCLFSSYLGGKSGLRGRCVQPCRRRYTMAGAKGKIEAGYNFSMNDLSGLAALPALAEAGVASLKIEGRMRSSHYVASVVQAYRLALDNLDDFETVLPECERLVDQAMGRKSTSGYFATPQPADALSPSHSGNIGLFMGRVGNHADGWATVKLQHSLKLGDRLRLHQEKSGERQSLTVKKMRSRGEQHNEAPPGWKIEILLGDIAVRSGDSLYKVDVKDGKGKGQRLKVGAFAKKAAAIAESQLGGQVFGGLALRTRPPHKKKKGGGKKKAGPVVTLHEPPVWLRADDWGAVQAAHDQRPQHLVLQLDRKSFEQAMRQRRRLRHLTKIVIWGLPPVILEGDLEFYEQALLTLMELGFFQFQVGHLGQVRLVKQAARAMDGKHRKPVLTGGYTLNILNSLALRAYQTGGLTAAAISIETDLDNARLLALNRGQMKIGMEVYGFPPLFTARLQGDFFDYGRLMKSPRGEEIILKEKCGQTVAQATEPFSLLDLMHEVARLNLDYVGLDISGQRLKRKDIHLLFQRLRRLGKGRPSPGESHFNFRSTLL